MMAAKTLEEIRSYIAGLVKIGREAQKKFERDYTEQRPVDEVVQAIGKKIYDNGEKLAGAAVGETQMGSVAGKVTKLQAVTLKQWNYMKGKPSVGYLPDDPTEPSVRKIAKPMGVIGCVMPSTNPIATVIGNAMMALKCRNAVVIAPHPGSATASMNTVAMIRDALKEIGAPVDLVQCVDSEWASIDTTNEMLRQCDVNIATGGAAMVKAVYSAGRPAFGVGQGNCQDIVDDYEDYDKIAAMTISSRAFDVGVPCTGDQTTIIPASKEEAYRTAMKNAGAYLIEDQATINKLTALIFPDENEALNRNIVGKTPAALGEMIGLDIPESHAVIVMKNQAKGRESMLCKEILCPIIRYTTYETFDEAVGIALENLEYEGAGHSSAIWSNNQDHIDSVAKRIPVGRFHINQPTMGFNNAVPATITIGCGSWGNNSISENLEFYHLMNITRVSRTLPNFRAGCYADWDDFSRFKITQD